MNRITEIDDKIPPVIEKDDYYFIGGKLLANPLPGEEVVISGMAGAFPKSRDIREFERNLSEKVNMVVPQRTWDCLSEIPSCSGALSDIDKYDCGFFGVHERQSHSLDAMARMFQEKVVEAIFDAGLHPSDLEGTRTGVYVGVTCSENDRAWIFDNLNPQTFAMTGSERSMIAHRVSYFLKLKGPSVIVDTACSSSSFALENAYRAIRLGEIDNAIVGGTNLCLYSNTTMQFFRLGLLSEDGICKAFDSQGNGYARSEASVAIVLQKSKNAKRVYAQLVHVKTNCDGFKQQGIMFPSRESQIELLEDLFDECGVDRFSLSFMEAHGTGTKIGDPEECAVIDSVFTGGRKTPLLIGSVKTSIGHTEPASGLCSILKCIIAMETGYIPPNINFESPGEDMTGLIEGRLKVVVEKTPLEDENALMSVNNFGFGGSNCHILLKRIARKKARSKGVLPRLVCVSGRTEEAVVVLLDQIGCNEIDVEYVKLLHEVFAKNIQNHLYRGYIIVSRSGEISRSLSFSPEQEKPLYLIFGEFNHWYEVGKQLMALPIFQDSISRINETLTEAGIDIANILVDSQSPESDSIPVIGSVAVQIAIVHLLNLIDVKPSGSSGHSFGVLVSAYCDKILTLDETIRCAFVINKYFVSGIRLDTFAAAEERVVTGKCDCSKNNGCKINGSATDLDEILSNTLTKESSGMKRVDCLVNALRKNSHFHHVDNVQPNSVILEIGKDYPGHKDRVSVVPLFESGKEDYLVEFLVGLGRLYTNGFNPQIDKLYPPVDFPVSRGTPMVSPYIRWKHTREKFVPHFTLDLIRQAKQGVKLYRIAVGDQQWAFITNNIVNGKCLFPTTGYLYMAWETFVTMHGMPLNASRITLKDCSFLRSTSVPEKEDLVFTVSILIGSGRFEVVESNSVVITGTISFLPENEVGFRKFNHTDSIKSDRLLLKKREIYTELHLRGYNYSGEFQAIEESDITFSNALIKWQNNWIIFFDNMLQLKVLQGDNRSLQVPIFLSNLNIVADSHSELIRELCKDSKSAPPHLPVRNNRITGKIRCGGITVSGLITNQVERQKDSSTPVLESYEFIPNTTELDVHDSVRVNADIIVENALVKEFKTVELIDEFSDDDAPPLTPIIKTVLERGILVQPYVKILSARPLDVDVEVYDKKLDSESDCVLVIASKVLNRPETLKSAFAAVEENGFVLSRESRCCDVENELGPDIAVLTIHRTPLETIVLLRKQSQPRTTNYIKTDSSEGFSWLPKVQSALNKKSQEGLVLFSEKDPTNGILGMVNCLRREPGLEDVRCVFVMDGDEDFNPNCDHLKKNMAVNVYKNGNWGTYRHFALEESRSVESEHSFVDITEKGNLSSVRRIEGPLKHHFMPGPGKELVYVYYASLNFRDVIIATEKINGSMVTSDPLQQDSLLGLEFSGRDKRGNRVMGTTARAGLSNLLLAHKRLIYSVPDDWTLADAATVPMAYTTAIYALIMCGHMKKGESILIHCGSGSVGQAAINLALHYGCEVFATVSSSIKRQFIKEFFPQLKDENIGASHDDSFEQMVYKGTNGRGVDIVLNSLTGDKLEASARCLAEGGRLIRIGKSHLESDRRLSLLLFNKQASFHGVTLDETLNDTAGREIRRLFRKLMEEGTIKPLKRKIFVCDEIEKAFRFAATGTHIGKVLIKVREPEKQLVALPSMQKLNCMSRYYCDPERVYVIVGGLGGIGLELADWLVLRGARKLVLTSRRGITTGYQQYRIRLWESYGVIVKTSTAPVVKREGCRRLIEESLELGRIAAVFNLAVVLADAIFENQTPESFAAASEPKAVVTRHLDDLTRTMCADLGDFVVFSSVCCGRGHGGQTNYGMANSVMERICDKRKRDGYPAVTVQFGLVGEVGIMAEREEVRDVGGTGPQSISSCLRVLDSLLTQQDSTVVSSMVVAQKQERRSSDNVVDAVINIIGLRDSKLVSSYSTLAELGLDSMIAVEIRLILERDFQIHLSANELRTMTLARLKQIQERKDETCPDTDKNVGASPRTDMIFRLSRDELDGRIFNYGTSLELGAGSKLPKLLLFPGIEGRGAILKNLSARLNDVTILQYPPDDQTTSVVEIVHSLLPTVESLLSKSEPFTIVGYSYGALVALEVVHILESRGYAGTVICVDGAPLLLKRMLGNSSAESEGSVQSAILSQILSACIPQDPVAQSGPNISKRQTCEEKVNFAKESIKSHATDKAHHVEALANAIYERRRDLDTYVSSYNGLKSNVKLFKATCSIVQDMSKDYGLSKYFEKPVEIRSFPGNHETILENEKLAEMINLSVQQ